MRHTSLLALGLSFVGATVFPSAQSPAPKAADERFRSLPQAANIRSYMQRLSARPHHVGSANGKDNAEWILARFREWGWEAEIERFDVLFPTPKERVLELVEPTLAHRLGLGVIVDRAEVSALLDEIVRAVPVPFPER